MGAFYVNGDGQNIIAIANGNQIDLSTSAPLFIWNETTSTGPNAMAVNNGYIANNAGLVTFTLPTTSAVGDVVRIAGYGSGGWTVTYTTGQSIIMGLLTSTVTTGNIASSNRYDDVELICTVADTTWKRIDSSGNITVV